MSDEKYIQAILKFRPSVWSPLTIEQKLTAMNDLLDFYKQSLYLTRAYIVVSKNFDNITTMAKYDQQNGRILIKRNLLDNSLSSVSRSPTIKYPSYYALFYMLHEIKHLEQSEYLQKQELAWSDD